MGPAGVRDGPLWAAGHQAQDAPSPLTATPGQLESLAPPEAWPPCVSRKLVCELRASLAKARIYI